MSETNQQNKTGEGNAPREQEYEIVYRGYNRWTRKVKKPKGKVSKEVVLCFPSLNA